MLLQGRVQLRAETRRAAGGAPWLSSRGLWCKPGTRRRAPHEEFENWALGRHPAKETLLMRSVSAAVPLQVLISLIILVGHEQLLGILRRTKQSSEGLSWEGRVEDSQQRRALGDGMSQGRQKHWKQPFFVQWLL